MSATSATLRGRTAAEALQVDLCTITRTATSVVDPDTGVITGTTTTVYTGRCRLKLPVAVARPSLVGQAQEFLQHPILSLPATTTGVQINDVLTITASLLMPVLIGRVFHIRAVPGQSQMTAGRYEVMEVQSG
jgi:hypothetical protein